MTQTSSIPRAMLFALFGFTCWTVGDITLKLTGVTSTPKYEIMALGCFGGMVVIFFVTALRGKLKKLKPRHPGRLAAVGVLYLLNYTCSVIALPRLPLTNYYTVIFMAPSVVALLAAFFLREHLNWKHGLAIAAGFLGVIIAVNPVALFQGNDKLFSYGVAFIGMGIFATQMVALRVLATQESRECTSFYPRTIALAGSLIAIVVYGYETPSSMVLFYALASGGIGGIGWLCMAEAYKLAPAATVAPLHYSQIVTGTLFGFLIWHDVPKIHTLLGATIIIASGLYIVTYARKAGRIAKALAENP